MVHAAIVYKPSAKAETQLVSVFIRVVFVTLYYGNCIIMYDIEGRFLNCVCKECNGETQFNYPRGVDVSYKNNNVYVCEKGNARVQILTEELESHSMLGIVLFQHPLYVKVTGKNLEVLVNKRTFQSVFDIDKDYNVIMSE